MRKELLTPASLKGLRVVNMSLLKMRTKDEHSHGDTRNCSIILKMELHDQHLYQWNVGHQVWWNSVRLVVSFVVRGSNVTSRAASRQSSTSSALNSMFLGRESASTESRSTIVDQVSSPASRKQFVTNRSVRTYGTKNISKLYEELLREPYVYDWVLYDKS